VWVTVIADGSVKVQWDSKKGAGEVERAIWPLIRSTAVGDQTRLLQRLAQVISQQMAP
jgi:hypothetical protein